MPSSGTSADEARSRIGEFFSNPFGAIARLAGKPDAPFYFPVEVDTETGLVEVQIPADALKPRGRDVGVHRERYAEANSARRHLETAFATGVVPEKTPRDYRGVAELIANLAHDEPQPEPSQFDAPEPAGDAGAQPDSQTDPFPEFSMAGYIPPGGVAGFAQMAPASRIALTQGVRTGGGGRRRRKKKTAKRAKRARRARGGKRKLVKGSAAARRHMARLRAKRRK